MKMGFVDYNRLIDDIQVFVVMKIRLGNVHFGLNMVPDAVTKSWTKYIRIYTN